MNRLFQWLNLLGVLLLAGLCCLQWSALHLRSDRIHQLEQTGHEQSKTIASQSQQVKDADAELTDVRERLDISESTRHADEAKLVALQSDRDRLAAETAQLKEALSAWRTACTARDAAIKHANSTIATLSARYADAVSKYNDLVAKYNHLVYPSQAAQTKP